jgi:hypothetical protein
MDMVDITCGDHTLGLSNVEVRIPDGDWPFTIPAGTLVKAVKPIICPKCGGRWQGVTLSEDFLIEDPEPEPMEPTQLELVPED